MSEENTDIESGEAGFPVLPTVGTLLREAREKQNLTVADIAQHLKLGSRQVEAVENGDWKALPGNTFIRGFVRNYARIVRLDPVSLMEQLDGILQEAKPRLDLPQTDVAVMPQSGHTQRRDMLVVAFGLVAVAVAAALYFLLPADLSGLRDSLADLLPAGKATREAEVKPAQEPLLPPGTTTQQVLNPQAVTAENASATGVAMVSAPAPVSGEAKLADGAANLSATAVPTGSEPLRFSFDKDSWVEVRDRDNKIIHSLRSLAGTVQAVSGQGPFSIVIGNAPGVRLTLRGKPVDLAPYTRGDVARLTLE